MNRLHWKKFGVDLYGGVLHDNGLGDVSRAIERSLNNTKVDHTVTPHLATLKYSMPNRYPINIIVGGAESSIGVSNVHHIPRDEYTIGVWFWELEDYFPWVKAYDYVDEIWCFSKFCQDVFTKFRPDNCKVPIYKMSYPIIDHELLNHYKLCMDYNLDPSTYMFLYSFDFYGSIERKNPYAVVNAFISAFGNNKDVTLVIKSVFGEKFPAKLSEFKNYIRNFPNIIFIDQMMDKVEFLTLINLCNCYVSLHRSEGLGIGMMEAMYYGKPVIATGYGGSMEFTEPSLCNLVPYTLENVLTDQCYYNPGSLWADPKVIDAAKIMQDVYKGKHAPSKMISDYIVDNFNQQTLDHQIFNRLRFIKNLI